MVNRNQEPRAIDAPEPCWLRMRLEPHGPYLPARIFHGTRPVSIGLSITGLLGEIEDRAAEVDWLWASGDLITEAEWLDLIRDRSRAKPF